MHFHLDAVAMAIPKLLNKYMRFGITSLRLRVDLVKQSNRTHSTSLFGPTHVLHIALLDTNLIPNDLDIALYIMNAIQSGERRRF